MDLTDFCERAMTEVAIVVPIHLPYGQIAADIIRQSMTFYGIYFGREMQSQRAHELLAEIFTGIASRELRVPIDRTFGLAEAASAHRYAETGHPVGRVVIVP